MEERELSDSVRRKDVSEADVLGVIAQSLPLILSREFLVESIWHLEIRAAKVEDPAQTVVCVKLIVEPEKAFSSAAEVMKVIECRRIQIALRCACRQVC